MNASEWTAKLEAEKTEVKRIFARCRRCKAKFAFEMTAWDWRGFVNAGSPLEALPVVAAHSCEFVEKWRGKAPLANILRSSVSVEPLAWKVKPGHAETTCGGACIAAKGPNCDCKCKGTNHGKGGVIRL